MDIRFALRLLVRAPGFTAAVVLVLALGIGSNSAIFSALDKTVIRPLPYKEPDRLVTVWEDFSAFGVPKQRVSPATFLDWRSRNDSFSEIAAYAGPGPMDLSGGGTPEEVLGMSVTANLLPMLGVRPMLGRTFISDEESPSSRAVVLSYRLWHRSFGADASLVGRSILMSGEKYTVLGVMPRGFQYPDRQTELWLPLGLSPQIMRRRNSHFLKVVGRIHTNLAQAQADMSAVAAQLAAEFPASNNRVGITVVPLKDEMLGDRRMEFTVLLGAAGCVLLIACANVGNLMLARSTARRREIAVRVALGASPGRVLRQILTENLLLAAAGATVGLAVAQSSMVLLEKMIPVSLVGTVDLGIDARVLAFTAVIATLTGVLLGLAPALQLSRLSLATRGAIGDRGRWLRDVLVSVEVAIALVLVIGATLLIQTLGRLRAVDPGFRAAGVVTADVSAAGPKYRDAASRRSFYNAVLAAVRSIPGVTSAGLTSDLPYTSRGNTMSLAIEGKPAQPGLGQDALFRLVSSDYLETLGTTLKQGRFLDRRDSETATPVVVINEALARTYWPGENPIGRHIDTGTGDGKMRWMKVVGVVADVRERGLDLAMKPAVYVPFPQTDISFFVPSEIAVLTVRDPLSLSRELQQAVWSVDPEEPVSNIQTMNAIVDGELSDRTQVLALLRAFAALALLLAALGIYGVLSYMVSQRKGEIGLRMAVGASPWDVVHSTLVYAARLTAAGLAAGIALAWAATRLLTALLYSISPLDVRTFAGVSAALAMVAMLASYVPARRAAAVDPAVTLREE
jgi:putative ABC transport system permease protein